MSPLRLAPEQSSFSRHHAQCCSEGDFTASCDCDGPKHSLGGHMKVVWACRLARGLSSQFQEQRLAFMAPVDSSARQTWPHRLRLALLLLLLLLLPPRDGCLLLWPVLGLQAAAADPWTCQPYAGQFRSKGPSHHGSLFQGLFATSD